MKIREITDAIEQYAPLRLQEEWDNAGIQVGDPEAEIGGVLLCTDATEAVVAEAIAQSSARWLWPSSTMSPSTVLTPTWTAPGKGCPSAWPRR